MCILKSVIFCSLLRINYFGMMLRRYSFQTVIVILMTTRKIEMILHHLEVLYWGFLIQANFHVMVLRRFVSTGIIKNHNMPIKIMPHNIPL